MSSAERTEPEVEDAQAAVEGREPAVDGREPAGDSRQSTEDPAAEVEPSAAEPAGSDGEAAGEEPEASTDPLADAERQRDEYLALAQRTQADFENFRKRAAKEAAVAGERAKSGFVGELLPVVDNLERALQSAGEQEEHLAGGVQLVHSELVAVLQRNGVEPFDPKGERFDPTVHEALSTRAEEGAEAGVVLDVIEKGYRLNGTVLRPARVVVSG